MISRDDKLGTEMFSNADNQLVIIVGAMKSGTTSLFKHLSQHPNICPSIRSETHFFSSNFERGPDYYAACWPAPSSEQSVFLESSPTYLKAHLFQGVPERIYAAFPSAKLICILRDPVERLEANYRQYLNDGRSTLGINDSIPDELVETSMYHKQINLFYEVFPREQILIIRTTDLEREPQSTLQNILRFLKLPHFEFKGLDVKYGDSRVTNTFLYQSLRRINLLKTLVNCLPLHVKKYLLELLAFQRASIPDDRWRLTAQNRQALESRLYPDTKKLSAEFGIEFKDDSSRTTP